MTHPEQDVPPLAGGATPGSPEDVKSPAVTMPTVTGLIGLPLPGPASLGQLAQQVAWPPRRELATPPSLLAYNKYAEELRDTLKDTAQLTAEETGVQLEKVIGQRWKEMPKLEKDVGMGRNAT
jgi:hypothetical protein